MSTTLDLDDVAAHSKTVLHELAALREEVVRLRADRDCEKRMRKDAEEDAERYRWLRSVGGRTWTHVERDVRATNELFDVATDQEMAKVAGRAPRTRRVPGDDHHRRSCV